MNKQALRASISWKRCADLPAGLSKGKTTIIDGQVYCGGGWADHIFNAVDDVESTVYCYDPSRNEWTSLPPLPVNYFGLGQVNGKLVAVGGQKKSDAEETYAVLYTYDERSRKWKKAIPPMPTARHSPGVLSLQSALVVAGGNTSSYFIDTVEIFKPGTSQWYRTDPLPVCGSDISLIAIGNTCYALGGHTGSQLNSALYASVDDLLGNAVPADQTTTHSGRIGTQSAWKLLPNTPTYGPVVAVLAGTLLAIGGESEPEWPSYEQKKVYMYSPSANSWIYISDLPYIASAISVAVLSSTEILIIGGWNQDYRKAVYMGTLHLI